MPDPFDFANQQPDYSDSEPVGTESTPRRPSRKRRQFSRKDSPQPTIDRQPPFNIEAEVGVLGSIMLMPDKEACAASLISRSGCQGHASWHAWCGW